jgi:hypothetical protein
MPFSSAVTVRAFSSLRIVDFDAPFYADLTGMALSIFAWLLGDIRGGAAPDGTTSCPSCGAAITSIEGAVPSGNS